MKIELIIVIIAGIGFIVSAFFSLRGLIKMTKLAKEIKKLSEEIEIIEIRLKTLTEKALTFEKSDHE
jgi:uncharacterized membrane protein YciS (DUF1049 family)